MVIGLQKGKLHRGPGILLNLNDADIRIIFSFITSLNYQLVIACACEQDLPATYESINITTSHRGCLQTNW